ncbi:MAG: tRNA (N6-threonylcarbamoyladenosine(37)-N6)-methyltransferase TrmO [Spirochaetales bacterium]|nr:tRNA (N6-threonylcarbamoyladenosine(37)-N6)-methyltransferase TrmO [Spirochaetales bacterium]
MKRRICFEKIGLIKTPYTDKAPYQPFDDDAGEFRIIVDPEYKQGLRDLEKFAYIYVIYYIDHLTSRPLMSVIPPWTNGMSVGIFASRAPNRPNPVGISVVRLKRIVDNEIYISGIDVFNDTPLLDIKPYIRELDSKEDANYGWIDGLDGDGEHLMLHIRGVPHDF